MAEVKDSRSVEVEELYNGNDDRITAVGSDDVKSKLTIDLKRRKHTQKQESLQGREIDLLYRDVQEIRGQDKVI